MTRILAAAAVACLAASPAFAGERPSPLKIAQHIFEKADTDKNGVLTISEHKSAGLDRFGASFADFDVDRNSKITWDEYKALFQRHHKGVDEREA